MKLTLAELSALQQAHDIGGWTYRITGHEPRESGIGYINRFNWIESIINPRIIPEGLTEHPYCPYCGGHGCDQCRPINRLLKDENKTIPNEGQPAVS